MTPFNISIIILLLILAFFFGYSMKDPVLGQLNSLVPYFRSAWIYHNGVFNYAYNVKIVAATTTPCAVQSPEATSTIQHASVSVKQATSSANQIQIGKSTDTGGIDTKLADITLAANAQGSVVASSSLQASDNWIIAPNNWVLVTFGQAYDKPANINCQVKFQVI